MTAVFADSYYLFALVDPGDPYHERAVAFPLDDHDRIVTTCWVLTEVADGLARSVHGRRVAPRLIRDAMTRPDFLVVPFSAELFADGLDLYARRPDKHWSLTDCVSFVVMGRSGIRDALTGDHHFDQAGFTALLK